MFKNILRLSLVLSFLIVTTTGAFAKTTEPRLLSSHGDWHAYIYEENGSKVCFMSSQPKKSAGNYSKRGEVFAFVTHWRGDGSKNVVSVATGYTYKVGSTVKVSANGKKFSLFTQKEMAWTQDQATDDALTTAIQKGSNMVVRGTSSRGTATTDTYSLKGSGGAYKAITKACDM